MKNGALFSVLHLLMAEKLLTDTFNSILSKEPSSRISKDTAVVLETLWFIMTIIDLIYFAFSKERAVSKQQEFVLTKLVLQLQEQISTN